MSASLDLPGTITQPAALRPGLPELEILAETPLPTRHGLLRCVVFRLSAEPLREHVAMLTGDVSGENVLVRLHSECITSEVFGSRRCDCRERLDLALEHIALSGRGVLVYRRRALGAPDDAPRCDAAAALLRELGVQSVRLLGGTPAQFAELSALGVSVRARLPLPLGARAENRPNTSSTRIEMNSNPNEMACPP